MSLSRCIKVLVKSLAFVLLVLLVVARLLLVVIALCVDNCSEPVDVLSMVNAYCDEAEEVLDGELSHEEPLTEDTRADLNGLSWHELRMYAKSKGCPSLKSKRVILDYLYLTGNESKPQHRYNMQVPL
jgi:hypothetical protein